MNKKSLLLIILFLVSFFSFNKIKTINIDEDKNFITKVEIEQLKKELFQIYSTDLLFQRKDEMNQFKIQINDEEIKYDLKFFGEEPLNGWELYFSLHGGGGTPDSVNENAWERHKTLYQLKNGILLTPRSPTNTWNMWHQKHIDNFLDRLIKNMIVFHDVNPNKIYLMGYSAGGDGVYQLAPRMADRFAAAAMMAGHPNDASPVNLRNIGFTLHMGGKDSAYDRNKVAIKWKNELRKLNDIDSGGYQHFVKIYENKGHWMGGLDSSAISWLSNFTREPFPSKIIWKQDDVTHKRFYWLKVEKPEQNDLIIASIKNQIIDIEKTTVSNFIIQLNDQLIDMDKVVEVNYLGKNLFKGIVYRNKKYLEESLKEYGDPSALYYGEISVSIPNKKD
jgi:predicted esterase